MTTIELRRRARQRIRGLTPESLREADEFLARLEQRESEEATQELLEIPGFLEAFDEGLRSIEEGDVTPVADLARKY